MMKKFVFSRLIPILLLLSNGTYSFSQKLREPVDEVNPCMGYISHLLVPAYPTVHLPGGMVRVYPERNDFTGDLLGGLPVVVTSHRGISAFRLSAFKGSVKDLKPFTLFSYDLERITPYSYEVYLDEQQTQVHYAVSGQSAIYRFDFEKSDSLFLTLNTADGSLTYAEGAISGFRELGNRTRVYVYMVPDIKPANAGVLADGRFRAGEQSISGKNNTVVLQYPGSLSVLGVRYGISFISEEQARKNLEREIPGNNWESVASRGRKLWNEALGKIVVRGGTPDERTLFYTSLYRTLERPVSISEDGRYFSAFDGKVHDDEGIPFYTDDWIWDTYRAAHPLRAIIRPEEETRIIHSFIRMSSQMDHFWMPTFPEVSGDGRKMNSNHGVATVLDAWRKGITGFDLEKAYEACRKAITEKTLAPWSGKPAGELDRLYRELGYIPALHEGEAETIPEVHHFEKRQPVAVTLGTAYDEWCLAQIAGELGKTDDHDYFLKQSLNYRNLFHPESHFFHPRDKEGHFIQPFDYVFSGGQGARDYYGENNAWIYRWDVQHNIADLVNLMEGPETFAKNLDDMFSAPLGKSKYAFYSQLPDHTGNVGQFSMANEPSLHIPYLYNYAGQPWKTQKRIRSLLEQWFRNDLMGIPGDEDGGGLSAFVVFSMLGFYPVTPGLPMYNIGSPLFEEVVIQLENGKQFRIVAENAGPNNKYIRSAKLNGKDWDKPWFFHEEIVRGGEPRLVMDSKANKAWGSKPGNAPPSFQ